jgi:hypothetical protein
MESWNHGMKWNEMKWNMESWNGMKWNEMESWSHGTKSWNLDLHNLYRLDKQHQKTVL